MRPLRAIVDGLLVFVVGAAAAAQGLDLPAGSIPGDKSAGMMSRYWMQQAEQAGQRWLADYEARKTPDQIAAYQARLRAKFLEAIGGLPERTPLNVKVTGTVARDGYRVEKVIFESQPRHFVTALVFLPDAGRFKPPYPGVVVPCGHAKAAKGHDEYQSMGALLALNGMAALVFDPIDQGERGQYLGKGGWPELWGTRGHGQIGLQSTLLGRNTARFEIWDGMRAIDYLQSRPEVDPQRIGCTGNSGGGTQTSYLMALDDRIRAASPSCYLCGFPALLKTIGPQDAEQNIFGQLAFGMDHADYLMMRAPTPILICAATQDFFDIRGAWETFRYGKRLYTRLGFPERMDLLENDAKHNYNKTQREGVARWMSRWLLGKDVPISEPAITQLSQKEYQCTPEGQVMLLSGARSVYDLNEDYEKQLVLRRAELWKPGDRAAALAKVRQLAGIRRLADVPKPEVEVVETIGRDRYRIEKLLLKVEEGILLPALRFLPEKADGRGAVLYVHEGGEAADALPGGPIERMALEGKTVLALDLPGTGQAKSSGSEGRDAHTAYLLGRSCVGLCAEHVLIAARYLKEQTPGGRPGTVDLVAVGHVGTAALHAAAVEPDLFDSVKLARAPVPWSGAVHSRQPKLGTAEVVHGALAAYDLPDLAASLGKKAAIEQPAEGTQ
jgi:dienelactone hydrolase